MTPLGRTSLPCGADPEPLLTHAADHTTPAPGSHEATCRYCQAAIDEFADLWDSVHRWAARDTPIPEGFATTIMHRVRRIAQSPRHVASVTVLGATTVTSWVLGLIATGATLDTPSVAGIIDSSIPHSGRRRRRSRVRYGADGVDITELGEADIGVTLAITVQPDASFGQLADLVRHNIIAAISERTGIQASEVDITIADIDLARPPDG